MKRWILTAVGDSLGLEQRLNQLAREGLELLPSGDGFTVLGEFQPTNRAELQYFVETAPLFRSEAELRKIVELRADEGWEAVGTLNGLDVYSSSPLRFPEPPKRCPRRAKELLSAAGVLLSLLLSVLVPGARWYLSNVELFLHLSFYLLLPLGAMWIIWRLARLAVPGGSASPAALVLLRGGLSLLWRLWWILLCASVILTLLPLHWAMMVLLFGLILRLLPGVQTGEDGHVTWSARVSPLWRAACLGLALLMAIGLNRMRVTALIREFRVGSAAWTGAPTIQLSDVMDKPGEILSSEHRKQGSLLVEWESWSESSEEQRIECELYTCHLPGLRTLLMGRWLSHLPPEEEHRSAWAAQGNRLMLCTCTQPWERDPGERMTALLR